MIEGGCDFFCVMSVHISEIQNGSFGIYVKQDDFGS